MRSLRTKHHAVVVLKPGMVYVGLDPAVVRTVLGSCVAITLYCPRLHIGAICHAMLPLSHRGAKAARAHHPSGKEEEFRYIDTSMEYMLTVLHELGVKDAEIVTRLYGGSFLVSSRCKIRIGNQNIIKAYEIINKKGLRLVASDTGSTRGRKIIFNTETGAVTLSYLTNTNGHCPPKKERAA